MKGEIILKTGKEYIESLRNRNIKVYVKGQLLKSEEVIDHPFIRGHVNSAAMTFDLAHDPQKSKNVTHDLAKDWNLLPKVRGV